MCVQRGRALRTEESCDKALTSKLQFFTRSHNAQNNTLEATHADARTARQHQFPASEYRYVATRFERLCSLVNHNNVKRDALKVG